MPSIKEAIHIGAEIIRSAGIGSYRIDSRLLLSEILSMSIEEIVGKGDHIISENDMHKFMGLVERRASNEPIAYILGKKEFYGLQFFVNNKVLIPRPDSETIIDEALSNYDKYEKITILELGVGSGCLLLTIMKYMPNASGVAVDINPGSIEVAKKNYNNLELSNKSAFIVKDWNEIQLDTKFDLIISNPPYIKSCDVKNLQKDVKDYEPIVALVGGDDGFVAYREIAPIMQRNLAVNGIAILECGEGQHSDITNIMDEYKLRTEKYLKDLGNKVRCIVLTHGD